MDEATIVEIKSDLKRLERANEKLVGVVEKLAETVLGDSPESENLLEEIRNEVAVNCLENPK